MKLLLPALVLCCAIGGCTQKAGEYSDMKNNIVKIKEELKLLDFADSGSYPESVRDYFRYYGLDFADDTEHLFGTFESDGKLLAAHIYRTKDYKATIFVLHGYFDHFGQLNHLARYLFEKGYAVAAFDLPGHGLSQGRQGAIDDFSQYSRALTDFANLVKGQLKGPYHFVGHSTGAAAMLDYLLTTEDTIFDRVILAAPLVRCVGWKQTKIAYKQKIPFVKSVPRVFCENSSDREFLDFVKNKDPLHTRKIPLKWVRALHKWNEKIEGLSGSSKAVKVFQGTEDSTVDWKFNVGFIRKKFSNADITMIENARHELFNESVDIRTQVFSQINSYLEEK